MITVNEVQLKMFDDGVYHFIQFNGDSKSYSSVSPRHLPVPPYKVLLVEHLGNSFEEMQQAIKAKWGNRNTNIMHPDTLRLV